ncbi:sigma-70 family RNA polymerase sigma factor [Rubripirellula amarantea]|nr:sigma-70 family RNA polymerase sigma factor [Rubripirellula amarantea]MDA8745655.1 sigma-70 family RNA polymerase sigma factor [Rubripirellula amarantea]
MNTIASLNADQFAALGNRGYSLAFQILKHRDDAADAVQDALRQFIEHQNQFQSANGSMQAYFLKIVRNRCLDLKRKRRPSCVGDHFDPGGSMGDDPSFQAAENEQQRLVRDCLDSLADDSREIIYLRDFHGLSYDEISEVLGIAKGTVMSRLHRARLQLRERFLSPLTKSESC